MFKLDNLLKAATDAGNEASKTILKERKNLQVWQKQDQSPSTSADLTSNETSNDILGETDIKILSEEGLLSQEESKNLQSYWLINPLDDTSGFLKGSDEFCIMISLIHEDRPILALVKNPSKGDTFYAHRNTRVYKNDKILDISEQDFIDNQSKTLLNVNHLSKEDENLAKKHNLTPINIGSGLRFCAISEDRVGVYERFEKLNGWDVATGDFLVNQKGDFTGTFSREMILYSPLNYKCEPFICVSKESFLNIYTQKQHIILKS